jgi:hypothetical protein
MSNFSRLKEKYLKSYIFALYGPFRGLFEARSK